MPYHSSVGDATKSWLGLWQASHNPQRNKKHPTGVRAIVLGRPCHADNDIRVKKLCYEKDVCSSKQALFLSKCQRGLLFSNEMKYIHAL